MAALAELATKAGKASASELKTLLADLEGAVKKLEGADKASGEVYVKVAKKAVEKVGSEKAAGWMFGGARGWVCWRGQEGRQGGEDTPPPHPLPS